MNYGLEDSQEMMVVDRRKREYKDLVKMTPTTEELLSEEIDGEIFLYKRSGQCKICTTSDDLRNIIDSLLLFPKTYKEVLQAIEPLQEKLNIPEDERINYANIRNHQKNHLPFEKRLVREVVERRAREKNRSILEAGDRLLTAEAFYEVIVAKGWEDIANGYARPTLTQTMNAMEMLQKLETQNNDAYRPEELLNQLDMILMAIREVVPNDIQDALFRKIEEYQGVQRKAAEKKQLTAAEEDEGYYDADLEEEN
jgi:hypothetical protein